MKNIREEEVSKVARFMRFIKYVPDLEEYVNALTISPSEESILRKAVLPYLGITGVVIITSPFVANQVQKNSRFTVMMLGGELNIVPPISGVHICAEDIYDAIHKHDDDEAPAQTDKLEEIKDRLLNERREEKIQEFAMLLNSSDIDELGLVNVIKTLILAIIKEYPLDGGYKHYPDNKIKTTLANIADCLQELSELGVTNKQVFEYIWIKNTH